MTDKTLKVWIWILGFFSFLLIFFSFFAPWSLLQPNILPDTDFSQGGELGKTIGGLMAPFIAIGAALLIFIAFLVQYQANQRIQEQFKIQQFESQFYEMLRLHKENVNEMKITGYGIIEQETLEYNGDKKSSKKTITKIQTTRFTEARKVFVTMVTELVACYELIEFYNNHWSTNYEKKELLKLAYQFFFFGVKSDLITSDTIETNTIDNFRTELVAARKIHKNSFGENNAFPGVNGNTIKLYIKYSPFSGHESRLGHYYRHLYSTVKFVVNQENKLFNYDEVRAYLKILRSQMSNDEQLMLYYNCIIGFGKDWEDKGYLTKYRMLHNLPITKVKHVDHPITHFSNFISSLKIDEGSLFEWGDTINEIP